MTGWRRSQRRYTPRRAAGPVEPVDGLRRRHSILRRVLLEAVPLDSDAYRRHAERLRKVTERGGDEAERVAVYERTIEELGLTARYAELAQRHRMASRARAVR